MHETEIPSAPTSRTLPHRTQLTIVVVLALLILAALGLGWATTHLFGGSVHVESNAKTSAVPGTFRPTPDQLAGLEIVTVDKQNFRTEYATDGKIVANGDRVTPVFSPYSGRVTKIIANLGDYVRQGAPLLTLEAGEFVQGQNDLAAAGAALSTARAQLNQAQINEKRKHGLYDIKAGSLQDWQQSQSDLTTAQSTVRSAEIALAAVRNRLHILGKTSTEIGNLENIAHMDPHTSIVAPIGGTVIDRQVGLGQYVQANASNPLYTVGDMSTVWLVANVREEDAPLMRRGASAEVRVAALPQKLFKAKITFVAASVDPNTHRLPVRAEIANPEGMLKPEMFASFTIAGGDEALGIGVPEQAILYEGDTARVWIAQKEGTLALRSIRAGRNNSGMVEVLTGLAAGDKVVTSGSLFIDQAAKGK